MPSTARHSRNKCEILIEALHMMTFQFHSVEQANKLDMCNIQRQGINALNSVQKLY
jgi:hypothetical protein